MKILVIQDRLRSGGTERQSILLTRAFASAGHDATLLTFRPGGALAGSLDGAAHRSLQRIDLGLDFFAPGLRRTVARLAPDVILCMGRMANCRAGALQRDFPAAAVVATLRTGMPLPGPFRRSLNSVRHVVANSREAQEALVSEFGVPAERTSHIYNSLVFPPAAEVARDQALRRENGTTVLLSVAMFRPEKNQRELIEIAAGLPPEARWELHLAGEGTERRPCERLARRRGLGGRVSFAGFQADPGRMYSNADIAVHASLTESLSNFLIEAQARGLPAVAYEARGVRECFIPDRTGWAVRPGDRAGFRDALLRLMAEAPPERAARSADARSYARANFDRSRQVAAYLDLFARLAAHAP